MLSKDARVYEGILEMLSGVDNPTPMVRLNRVVPSLQTKIYAKLEWYNPFGSVKDRVAHNLLRDADEKGLLGEGQQLVEPTSGNTGMGFSSPEIKWRTTTREFTRECWRCSPERRTPRRSSG